MEELVSLGWRSRFMYGRSKSVIYSIVEYRDPVAMSKRYAKLENWRLVQSQTGEISFLERAEQFGEYFGLKISFKMGESYVFGFKFLKERFYIVFSHEGVSLRAGENVPTEVIWLLVDYFYAAIMKIK